MQVWHDSHTRWFEKTRWTVLASVFLNENNEVSIAEKLVAQMQKISRLAVRMALAAICACKLLALSMLDADWLRKSFIH